MNHQERSEKAFNTLYRKPNLLIEHIPQIVHLEVMKSAVQVARYNIEQILNAHIDKKNGGEGIVHNIYFDN